MPYDNAPGGDCRPADCCPRECGPYDPWGSPLHGHLWFQADYLLWWTAGSSLPPLVTTSLPGTSSNVAGVLGQTGTRVLFGDQTVDAGAHSGGRITLGYWFDPCQCLGVEASYLGMGRETTSFFAASPGTAIIARPYLDTQTNSQSALLIAYPTFLQGSVNVDVASEFQAAEVLLRRNLVRGPCEGMDFLVGWRFARLDESLQISQSSQLTAAEGPIVAGTTKSLFDQFNTENEFEGAELGVVFQEHVGRWSLETVMKVALGNTHSHVVIGGATTTTVPGGGAATFTGGLLAQSTNIGTYDENELSVITELGATLGFDLTSRLRATFGYSFLYWSRVARPADQLDVAASQLPPASPTGQHRPAQDFMANEFWAQGMNFGLAYRF